jgi:hypothetical protein
MDTEGENPDLLRDNLSGKETGGRRKDKFYPSSFFFEVNEWGK